VDAIEVLYRYGVRSPERVYQELTEARRGDEITIDRLKMKPPKKKQF